MANEEKTTVQINGVPRVVTPQTVVEKGLTWATQREIFGQKMGQFLGLETEIAANIDKQKER